MKCNLFLILAGIVILTGCSKWIPGPDSRTFHMGVTPFPPEFSNQGKQLAYDFINHECDMAVHHFDDGVPWEEMLNGTPIPDNVMNNLIERLQKTQVSTRFVSVAPLKIDRLNRAGYWGEGVSDDIKNAWENKSWSDSTVVQAYVNWCNFLITFFDPIYFNYGVEINHPDWGDADFNLFLHFCDQVYHNLKTQHPTIDFFVSYMVNPDQVGVELAKKMNPFSDHISLSSYPYMACGSHAYGSTSIEVIPDNWFSRYRDIDPSKPFSIAETGYIAEDLDMSEYGLTKMGREEWQTDYLNWVLETCQKYNAKFINYFCAYDYDAAYSTLVTLGFTDPLFKAWKDIGFYNEEGIERPSLGVWKKWQSAPLQP